MSRQLRVFVTGLGMISPAGLGAAALWADLQAARARFVELEPLYPRMKSGVLGGRVPLAAREEALRTVSQETRTRPRAASVFSEYAALEALADAGLAPGSKILRNAVICIGSSDGQADAFESLVAGRQDSAEAGGFLSYSIADGVARAVGSCGPTFTVHNTCASANVAIACALEMLRDGVCETAIVGGCDPYSERNVIGFSSLQSLGPTPCRPFAKDRRYVTPSEGAGVLVLQTEPALSGSQRPYAEIVAAAVSNDARHPTAPDREGMEACHALALDHAKIDASDIDVIFAHGTGSRANDALESAIFTARYPRAAVTAIKGTIGHLMGAAGAAGAVASCLALRNSTVPPTATNAADVEADLNLVTGGARTIPSLRYVQSNAFGFGGNNAICIFRKT